MSEQERPRARAAQEGLGALNDRELIALLLGTGHKGRSAESLAQEVLELAQGCLNNLASWPVESLTVVNGIGPAKATLVAAAMELGRRREGAPSAGRVVGQDQPRRSEPICVSLGGLATRGVLGVALEAVQPRVGGNLHFKGRLDRHRGRSQTRLWPGLGHAGGGPGVGAQPSLWQSPAE